MTDYPWAYVGAKIICVDDKLESSPTLSRWGAEYTDNMDGLTVGTVYTIRSIGIDRYEPIPCVWLDEIIRPLDPDFMETGYSIHRFRPLHTIESDVELFCAALTPTIDDIVYENALALLDEAERELEEAWGNGQ